MDPRYSRIFNYASRAAEDALDGEGRLPYDEALEITAGLYTRSWCEAQQKRVFNPIPREMFPTSASRDLFMHHWGLQAILCQRDPLLVVVDRYIRETVEAANFISFPQLLKQYVRFAFVENGFTPRHFRAECSVRVSPDSADTKVVKVKLPTRRWWALFLACHELWSCLALAPRMPHQLVRRSRNPSLSRAYSRDRRSTVPTPRPTRQTGIRAPPGLV